jgi:hypothetical protein
MPFALKSIEHSTKACISAKERAPAGALAVFRERWGRMSDIRDMISRDPYAGLLKITLAALDGTVFRKRVR